MTEFPAHGLFITGTDTNVGKTYVTALIARALVAAGKRVGAYKPVASGCRRVGDQLICEDAERLRSAIGGDVDLAAICPQSFEAPLAPQLAARAAGKMVDRDLLRNGIIRWKDCDIVLIEGVGGLMSPISDDDYVADLASDFAYPLIVVAANSLGVINQTLQTLITAATFRDGLDVAGIVLNRPRPSDPVADPSLRSNRDELARHCVPPVLAEIGWQSTEFPSDLDWLQLAARRR